MQQKLQPEECLVQSDAGAGWLPVPPSAQPPARPSLRTGLSSGTAGYSGPGAGSGHPLRGNRPDTSVGASSSQGCAELTFPSDAEAIVPLLNAGFQHLSV